VDEANAAIGMLRLHCTATTHPTEDAVLARIQNDLFDLGADLCVPYPQTGGEGGARLRLGGNKIEQIEADIALINASLPPLFSFVLPGGSAASANAHLARTISRRAERRVVTLSHTEAVNPNVMLYLNRLSDLLFVLGRRLNDNAAQDVLWVPGGR
jgi:cob(I)alamin adenosyltransferase